MLLDKNKELRVWKMVTENVVAQLASKFCVMCDQLSFFRLETVTAMSSLTRSPSSPLTGGCFCSAIKYELSQPPFLRAYCRCIQFIFTFNTVIR